MNGSELDPERLLLRDCSRLFFQAPSDCMDYTFQHRVIECPE